jgi:hypothetical protein
MSDATGVSRRDFLKRGAALGGAIAWATPVVQAVGMQSAFAQTTSPGCFAVKIQRGEDDIGWEAVAVDPDSPATCLPDASEYEVGIGQILAADVPEENGSSVWTVTLAPGCAPIGLCYIFSANQCLPASECDFNSETGEVTFSHPSGSQDISHVEFAFCCGEETV